MKEAERIREAVKSCGAISFAGHWQLDPKDIEDFITLREAAKAHADMIEPMVQGSDAVPPLRSGADLGGQECGTGLKPCPFCGEPPRVIPETHYGDACVDCECEATPGFIKPTLAEAIAAWNRRPPTPAANVIDGEKLRELINAAYSCRNAGSDVLKIADFWPLIAAAESTLPPVCKTKTVEVYAWGVIRPDGVWAAIFKTEAEARGYVCHDWSIVKLSGKATVPA